MNNIYTRIADVTNGGQKAALCIIVNTKGSSPRKTGSKMIIFEDGTQEGTIGGGDLELRVAEDAIKAINQNNAQKNTYNIGQDQNDDRLVEIYIEPVSQPPELYIFGAGHVGKSISKYAPDFDFKVTIVDNRKKFAIEPKAKNIQLISEDYISFAKNTKFTNQSFIVIVTPKHEYDESLLAICSKKPFAYLGMIGSKKKITEIRERLSKGNILSEEELNRIDMPIGIKFNSQTPEEIAISILAKLIDVKNSNIGNTRK